MPSVRQQSNFSQLKAHDEQLERLGLLGERLAQEFGRGFEAKYLRRMVQFAQADGAIVATLSRQLSWNQVVALLLLKSQEPRLHYAEQAAQERWSVRELRGQIERKTGSITGSETFDFRKSKCLWPL